MNVIRRATLRSKHVQTSVSTPHSHTLRRYLAGQKLSSHTRSRRVDLQRGPTPSHDAGTGSSHPRPSPHSWNEENYRKIFELPLNNRPYLPSPWVHSLDAESCLRSLPPALRQDPLNVLNKTDGNPHEPQLVGQCLEAYVVLQHSKLGLREEARQVFSQAKLGTRALAWFLQSEVVESSDLALHPRLSHTLVHLLRAEHRSDLIWDWLAIRHTPTILATESNQPHL